MTSLKKLIPAIALALTGFGAQAAAVYTTVQYGAINSFHINSGNLTTMHGLLTANNTLTTGTDFSNPAVLGGYDALWVNDRYSTGASAAEINAMNAFISSGKKAVIITDNMGWAAWNSSIDAIVGGQITNACASADGSKLVSNALTAGVNTLYASSCNSLLTQTAGMDMLFSNDMAGLYHVGAGEALVLTSVDILINGSGGTSIGSNSQFAHNIADWLATPLANNTVPEPTSLALVGISLLALARRRRQA